MITKKAKDLQVGDKFSRTDADKYIFEIIGVIHKTEKSVRFHVNRLNPNPYGPLKAGFRSDTVLNIKQLD